MRNKVLVDANVLVAASVKAFITEVGLEFKHHFYDISKPLFDFFSNNLEKRIGIYTEIIETTSTRVLSEAIIGDLEEHELKKRCNVKRLFEYYSLILSECIIHLKENMNSLTREPVNEKRLKAMSSDILNFYHDIRSKLLKKIRLRRYQKP